MVKTLAAENVRRGITANAVLPGMVATEKVRAMPDEILERLMPTAPLGPHGRAGRGRGAVAYLCSERGRAR